VLSAGWPQTSHRRHEGIDHRRPVPFVQRCIQRVGQRDVFSAERVSVAFPPVRFGGMGGFSAELSPAVSGQPTVYPSGLAVFAQRPGDR